MKKLISLVLLLGSIVCQAQRYQPEWISLQNYQAPEWYEDAKLGFWPIWGIYSVPAFMGDHAAEWYGRWMYCQENQSSRDNQGLATHLHHIETYGDPSEFGYKDFIPMFKAENFNADEWAGLAEQLGAKYFCTLGIFHDGFSMGSSCLTRWSATEMGPERDVVGELAKAARDRGLKYGVSNHLAWNYTFYQWNHINGYDAADPGTGELYGYPIVQPGADTMRMGATESRESWESRSRGSVRPSQRDLDRWLARTKEMADLYRPDLYYFDWGMNPPVFESRRKEFAAHYYNRAIEWGKGEFGNPNVVLNYKNRSTFRPGSAVLDFERGSNDEIADMVWQTDDCVYDGHNWGYAEGIPIKPVNRIIDEFVEIVSKRGVLMLAFAPKADGSFPEDQKQFIREMGAWMDACGEAIYSTRPWIKAVENCAVEGSEAIRACFTRSKDNKTLYATLLEWPETPILIKSINSTTVPRKSIKSISMIGSSEKTKWTMTDGGLKIIPPVKPSYGYAYPVKIKLK
ncbi:alpha-L-fucosidase [Bacteroidota bacterium]